MSEAHAHAEAPYGLQHQFDDIEQQHEADTLGIWLFLLTEIMFFGGMFTGYLVYRLQYFQAFAQASHELDVLLGAINTAVLIGSSLTVVLAVHAAQIGNKRLIVIFLILTILLGCVFLGIKGVEYTHKFHEGHVPGEHFRWEGPEARHAQIFFSFYFAMTGMHALHMIIGIVLMAILAWMAHKDKFTPGHHMAIEVGGLYWHFVDIVWIFLFPLLYLIGGHKF